MTLSKDPVTNKALNKKLVIIYGHILRLTRLMTNFAKGTMRKKACNKR